MGSSATERLLRRDRVLVCACLALICLLSWYYLLTGAGTGMSVMAMSTWQFPPPLYTSAGGDWAVIYWMIMLVMWWVMMIAMMIPSAAPMILLYARVARHNGQRNGTADLAVPTAVFLLGYLLAWLAFSLVATVSQWLLERAGLLHAMLMWSTSYTMSGIFLIAVGAYQFSPVKQVCLNHCRTPASFLAARWRSGARGALYMGLAHGQYCVGCCWLLMLLLFVGGTMNLVWIAGLALLVLCEKLLPAAVPVARSSAALMLLSGSYLLWSG